MVSTRLPEPFLSIDTSKPPARFFVNLKSPTILQELKDPGASKTLRTSSDDSRNFRGRAFFLEDVVEGVNFFPFPY